MVTGMGTRQTPLPTNTYGERFGQLMKHVGRPEVVRRLGVNSTQVSKILKEAYPPPLDTLRKHAFALKVQPSALLHGCLTLVDKLRRGDFDDIDLTAPAPHARSRKEASSQLWRRNARHV